MNQKNFFNKRLSIILIFSLFIGILSVSNNVAQATSKASKAKKAYAKILSNKSAAEGIILTSWGLGSDTKFALLDINRDGIPELLFTPDDGYHLSIASYVSGKPKSVGGGYAGEQRYYPKKKIYYTETIHMGDVNREYYRFNGKKMIQLASEWGHFVDDIEIDGYSIGKKKVSKSKYKKYIKKLLKGAKKVTPKFHNNTAANRKKYL